jgi:cysteinyl-tRNA synthetase
MERVDGFINRAVRTLATAGQSYTFFSYGTVPDAFAVAMDDDLNVPQALAVLHETVRTGNTALTEGNLDEANEALVSVTDMLRVLGISAAATPAADNQANTALEVLVEAQLAGRAEARANKDWAKSDAIRDTLKAAGVIVEDGPDGATWSLQRD